VPENIDWLGRRIRVEATLNLRNQRRESPKGGRAGGVTMPTIVADSLAAHLQAHPATEYVFHRADGAAVEGEQGVGSLERGAGRPASSTTSTSTTYATTRRVS
jgi:hypothetical protein